MESAVLTGTSALLTGLLIITLIVILVVLYLTFLVVCKRYRNRLNVVERDKRHYKLQRDMLAINMRCILRVMKFCAPVSYNHLTSVVTQCEAAARGDWYQFDRLTNINKREEE